MAANTWKNSLKNVESDNNKILYETLLDFFLQRNGTYSLNKPRTFIKRACVHCLRTFTAINFITFSVINIVSLIAPATTASFPSISLSPFMDLNESRRGKITQDEKLWACSQPPMSATSEISWSGVKKLRFTLRKKRSRLQLRQGTRNYKWRGASRRKCFDNCCNCNTAGVKWDVALFDPPDSGAEHVSDRLSRDLERSRASYGRAFAASVSLSKCSPREPSDLFCY